MKLELFTEVQSKLRSFVQQFSEIPIKGDMNSIAFQYYHFNNFKALTSTALQAMLHVNYAQLNRKINNISCSHSFSLTFDQDFQLIREFDFHFIKKDKQKKILQVLVEEIKDKINNKTIDNQSIIDANCMDRTLQLCALIGTIFKTDKEEYLLNLFYFRVTTTKEDDLLNLNFFLKDKGKHKNIYKKLIETEVAYDIKLLELLNDYNLTKKEFKKNIQYFFGDRLKKFKQKERFLRSVELVLFSEYSQEQIYKECYLKNSPYDLHHFFNTETIEKKASIIRYNIS